MTWKWIQKLVLVVLVVPVCAEVRGVKTTKKYSKKERQLLRQPKHKEVVVVPTLSGGRFGDALVATIVGLYFACKHGFGFRYPVFPFSEQLRLGQYYEPFFRDGEFTQYVMYSKHVDLEKLRDKGHVLLLVPYFPISESEYTVPHSWQPFPIDWENKDFIRELRKVIAPRQHIPLLYPPKDKTSVAVHVRRGGGFDKNISDGLIRYKIPYDEFYIEQIRKMVELVGADAYFYLFTDDPEPAKLAQLYKDALNIPGLEFHFRDVGNRHDANVLEDFFSLLNFDCLIRSESNFSLVAEKIGDFKIVLSPALLAPGEKIHRGVVTIKR